MRTQRTIGFNMFLNGLRTVMKIIFPLITYSYISRVLGAESIGKINFSSSIISYFAIIAALGITNYAVREGASVKNDKENRGELYNQFFSVNFVNLFIAYILLFLLLIISSRVREYGILILIHSLTMIFNWLSVDWLYTIYEDYIYITLRVIFVNIISIILMFLFVRGAEDYIVYCLIQVLATGGFNVFNYVHSKIHYRPRIVLPCNYIKHVSTMGIFAINLVAITVYVNSDMIIIGFLLNDAQVGYYSMAVKIYSIIKELLVVIITTVFPRCAFYFKDNKEKYYRLLSCVAKIIVLLVSPIFVGGVLLRNQIVEIFLGANYSQTADALGILMFGVLFSIIGTVFSTLILLIEHKELQVTVVTCISAIINIILNFICIPAYGIEGAACTTIISEGIAMMLYIYFSRKQIGILLNRTLVNAIIGTVGVFIICKIIKGFVLDALWTLILSVVISSIVYAFILVMLNESFFKENFRKIKIRL